MRYKISIALFFGAGLTSLLLLLLKASPAAILSVVLSMPLLPGGILADVLFSPREFSPPPAVLIANVLVYSAVTYAAILIFWRNASVPEMRRVVIRLAAPATILMGLACIPAFNPLWPRGMGELTKEESELQAALPLGVELSQGRSILMSRGIQFREETESSGTVVLEREGRKLTAAEGDRVVSARFQTGASVFPCGYDMEVVLLFGPDGKLKEQYVHRLRVCP
jgi:hypothetical protein